MLNLDKLRECVDASGYRHKYLAGCIGVSPVKFSYFMNGNRMIDIATYVRLCDVLGEPLEKFVCRPTEPVPATTAARGGA